MTTPTTAEVGHGSKEPTVGEIAGFRGRLISAGHVDYDMARAVWNGAIDRRPRLIARCIGLPTWSRPCVSPATTIWRSPYGAEATTWPAPPFATTGSSSTSRRCGACESIPPAAGPAVQGGALWGDVDHETQAHGLATTGGIVSHTGVAGLTLGGGIGWLMRKHGLTCRQPARRRRRDGRRRAAAGVRGRAPRPVLGVARRRRQLRRGHLVRVPPPLRRAHRPGRAHPLGRDRRRGGPPLLPRLRPRRSRRARHGREVRRRAAATGHPRGSALAPGVDGGYLYAGPIEDGEQALRPLRASRTPLLDLVGPTPYVGFQSALDSTVLHGWNYYWKSTHLPELRDDLIDVIAEHAFSCSSPRSYVVMFHLKGAVSRVAEGGTAFGNRQASHAITIDGVWRPGEDFGGRDTAWTREFFAALGRFREGVYVNFLGGDEDPERVREAYGDSVYDRLVDVKTTYDPDNVFHHNQNIRPGSSQVVGGLHGA